MLQRKPWKNIKTEAGLKKEYLKLYDQLVPIARQCGYALAIHGSKTRDLDLVAVPWTKKPLQPETLILLIENKVNDLKHTREYWKREENIAYRYHGRKAYSILISWLGKPFIERGKGLAYIDISFIPVTK